MIPVQIRFTKKLLDLIDELVKDGIYSNRSQAIRSATRDMLLKSSHPKIPDAPPSEG